MIMMWMPRWAPDHPPSFMCHFIKNIIGFDWEVICFPLIMENFLGKLFFEGFEFYMNPRVSQTFNANWMYAAAGREICKFLFFHVSSVARHLVGPGPRWAGAQVQHGSPTMPGPSIRGWLHLHRVMDQRRHSLVPIPSRRWVNRIIIIIITFKGFPIKRWSARKCLLWRKRSSNCF